MLPESQEKINSNKVLFGVFFGVFLLKLLILFFFFQCLLFDIRAELGCARKISEGQYQP